MSYRISMQSHTRVSPRPQEDLLAAGFYATAVDSTVAQRRSGPERLLTLWQATGPAGYLTLRR
jgi:hypothetical protein